MTGGSLLVRGSPSGEAPTLVAACSFIEMTSGSTLQVHGEAGNTNVDASSGQDAVMRVTATSYIRVKGSVLEVIAGAGLSPGSPLGPSGLEGDHCSGGDAELSLKVTGDGSSLLLSGSRVLVQGGRGGDAPDGLPQPGAPGHRGGGFSEGGPVGGRVGAGGHASMGVSAESVELHSTDVSVLAGDGGDAGDGGVVDADTGHGGGGGGGGYSGGGGSEGYGAPATPGGRVHGEVGSGGDATLDLEGRDHRMDGSNVNVRAGAGGEAGMGGAAHGNGGGGGGGYSGGGGGSDDEPAGAPGGLVEDGVASGGDASASLVLVDDVTMVGSTLGVHAGRGGDAGDGGPSTGDSGGGGGGYSGGGGAGSGSYPGGRPMSGGNGTDVTDRVASGGDASLRLNASTGYMEGDLLNAAGGAGGRGGRAGRSWQDPDTDVWLGGGGGGSYSAGGGGAYSMQSTAPRAGGEAGEAKGGVGDGGDASLRLEVLAPIIHADNDIACSRGSRGVCWRSSAVGETGGEGTGRFTRDGRAHAHVPVGSTELLTPLDGNASMEMPWFTWKPVQGSTTNGAVVGYSVEAAFEDRFALPVHSTVVGGTRVNFTGLRKGKLFWRVTPLYARPDRWPGVPSQPFVYDHLTAPPVVDEIPEQNVTVKRPHTVDLSYYIHDVDDPFDSLTVNVMSEHLHFTAGFLVTLRYDRYEPPHEVPFTVSDGMDSTRGRIPVRVVENNHDPRITGWGPYDVPLNVSVPEGSKASHQVRWYDSDGDNVTVRLITSWHGVYQEDDGRTIVVDAGLGEVGSYEPRIIVEDGRGGRDEVTMFLRIGDVGEPPDPPEFLSPRDGARYHEGDNVLFSIGVYDPDLRFGGTVNLTVISNSSGVLFEGTV
jgi:hypothetical protein